MPFVLGHALSMKALHGGKAHNERIDAPQIAVLLRGGLLPQASVYPAELRAQRHNTPSPDNLPEIGNKLAYQANRAGVAEGFLALAVPQRIAGDRALIDTYDHVLPNLELSLVQTAQAPAAQTFSRLCSIPGGGTILALVRL